MSAAEKKLNGYSVFIWFLAFFAVIILVNGVFIYTALGTHTGVVTERPYEKGLAYNEILAEAKDQPHMQSKAAFDDGVLSWRLHDENGKAVDGAQAIAKIIRPVQDGNDFEITLQPQGGGLYTADMNLPMKGKWIAKLSAQWNNDKNYHTTHRFMAK